MSDRVCGRKQPGVGSRQGTSREKTASSSDMSVYKSSAEASVRYKSTKVSSIYKSSEEYFGYSCDPCKSVGDHVEAHGFCTDCDEYLCGTCFRTHSRNKASKHHALLDEDAMPRKACIIICDSCKRAEDEEVAVGYCKECNEYLCDSCYKSHSRNKSSRHHVLVDKANMSEESERGVASSIIKMNSLKVDADNMRHNEEYSYIRDINVKADADEKDCFIIDMTLVSNTELVLCDYDNNSLKLINIDNSIIKDVLVLQAKPLGITTISKDQVAVVLENKYQMQIISVSGGVSVIRTLKTKGNCVDITFTNGKLYVSFKEPVQFQILQITGAISKTIKPDSEVLKHCTYPRHIAVSHDESMIYVSDWKTNKVMSIDMGGNMVSMYQDELEGPRDIFISPIGSIYLCNRNQQVVYKMMSNLRDANVILGPGDDLESPQAMCFITDKQHLYISNGNIEAKHRNLIKAYEWK